MQLFLASGLRGTSANGASSSASPTLSLPATPTRGDLRRSVARATGVPASSQRLRVRGRSALGGAGGGADDAAPLDACDGDTVELFLSVAGGIDFQNRVGSKFGGGGEMSEAAAAADRRERLRKLALETIDLTKDPCVGRCTAATTTRGRASAFHSNHPPRSRSRSLSLFSDIL